MNSIRNVEREAFNYSHVIFLTLLIYFVLNCLQVSHCQDPDPPNTTTTTTTTTTKRPIIIGGFCHYCDRCNETLDPPKAIPPPGSTRPCAFTNDTTVRCLVKHKVHTEEIGNKPVTHHDYFRDCLQNGTVNCFTKHIGITPQDARCFRTFTTWKSYQSYLSCYAKSRQEEWGNVKKSNDTNVRQRSQSGLDVGSIPDGEEENEDLGLSNKLNSSSSRGRQADVNSLRPTHGDTRVVITICACMGSLCNVEKKADLEAAEEVEGLTTPNPKLPNGVDRVHHQYPLLQLISMLVMCFGGE